MTETKKILIVGGAGYVGSALVPSLLEQGYEIVVYDLMIYGTDILPVHENLSVVQGDIRDVRYLTSNLDGVETVIHLACISNDPSFELNPELGKSINFDCYEPFVAAAVKKGVKRFIYASSSSVYGIKAHKDVIETDTLEPLTDYSKYKVLCEEVLNSYQSDKFETVIVRPATVCGYSPRVRLDVVVNIMSNLAYNNRKITIFGGDQLRPNINIKDMVRVYGLLIEAPSALVSGQTFNAGFENYTVQRIAEVVKNVIGDDVELTVTPTDDNRSYHVASQKLEKSLGFKPKYDVKDAVESLKHAFEAELLDAPLTNEKYFNIARMNAIELK